MWGVEWVVGDIQSRGWGFLCILQYNCRCSGGQSEYRKHWGHRAILHTDQHKYCCLARSTSGRHTLHLSRIQGQGYRIHQCPSPCLVDRHTSVHQQTGPGHESCRRYIGFLSKQIQAQSCSGYRFPQSPCSIQVGRHILHSHPV